MNSYIKQGDCLELMKEIPDGSVDMILADLPYGATHNEWDKRIPLEPLWKEYLRIIKENGAIVLFSQMPYGAELIMSQKKLFRYEIIWKKPNAVGYFNANRMPLRAHENVLIFYKKLPTYNPQKTKGKPYRTNHGGFNSSYGYISRRTPTINETGERFPIDVLTVSNDKYKSKHATQKPIAILEWLIKTYTNEGETVLDNVMGSGSTCVAAINTNRQYIGFELDEAYFFTAKQRIEEALNAKHKE